MSLFCGAFVLWAGPARAALVQPNQLESGSVIVTADTAEVREGPAPSFDVITVVEKGEIFLKLGRTGAWYYIRIDDVASGWISGRAISRYQAEESPSPYVGPYDARYPPYYSGGYFDYSYYYWGQPYLSWEWYFYDREPHRDRSWGHERDYYRDRDRDRPRNDGRGRDDNWSRGKDSPRGDDTGNRFKPPWRPSAPRIRGPFPRR